MQLSIQQRLANASLFALALFYIIMLGGGNYEHMNVTPVIAKAPPQSLAMLQGPYGFNPVKFWVTFRPLTILLFILAIVFNWKLSRQRRKLLIISFATDIAVTIATFAYFAPEAGAVASGVFNSELVDAQLQARAQLWKHLNSCRLFLFYVVGVLLLFAVNLNIRSQFAVR